MAGRTAYPPAADRPPRACPCDLAPVRRHGGSSSGLGHRPADTALKTYEKGNPPYCYRCLPDAGDFARRTCGASSTSACLQDGGRVESPPDKKLLSSSATDGVRSANAMTVAAVRWLSGDLCARTHGYRLRITLQPAASSSGKEDTLAHTLLFVRRRIRTTGRSPRGTARCSSRLHISHTQLFVRLTTRNARQTEVS